MYTYQEDNRWVPDKSNSSTQLSLVATTVFKVNTLHSHHKTRERILSNMYLYLPQRLSACLLRSSLVISVSTTSFICPSGIPLRRANIVRSSRPVRRSIRASNWTKKQHQSCTRTLATSMPLFCLSKRVMSSDCMYSDCYYQCAACLGFCLS